MNKLQRQTIEAWWVFFQLEAYRGIPEPHELLAWIEYANDNPEDCDLALGNLYNEYTPQI